MKEKKENFNIELQYIEGKSDPNSGYYEGGVVDPKYLEEIIVWVDKAEIFDFEKDAFIKTGDNQIHITGTRRALFELGRYLITLSRYTTENTNYHDHLEGLQKAENKSKCEIITHLPLD
jgi:hypothetical protein